MGNKGSAAEQDWFGIPLSNESAASSKSKPSRKPTPNKRLDQRSQRVQDGIEQLQRWLEQLFQAGLAQVAAEGKGFWEQQAARLVDAQARGLASRLRHLALFPAGPDWSGAVLAELGKLALLVSAYERLADLPTDLQWEVRQQVGFEVRKPERERFGTLLRDDWSVLLRTYEQVDRQLQVRRSWVVGMDSRRVGVLLDFSVPVRPFLETHPPGQLGRVTARFWPGTAAIRLEFLDDWEQVRVLRQTPPHAPDIATALTGYSQQLARNPFQDRWLLLLADTLPIPTETGPWLLRDRTGAHLPIRCAQPWCLLAVSGGKPLLTIGEWDGVLLEVGAVWTETGLIHF